MSEPFLLTVIQRCAAQTDPVADAELITGLIERATKKYAEAVPGGHLVLVSASDESLRDFSRMPDLGECLASRAEALLVECARRFGTVVLEPSRDNPLSWRVHDAQGSRDVDRPISFAGVILRDAAWLGSLEQVPVLHWRSNFRRELWSPEDRLRCGRGVTVITSPAGSSQTGERVRIGASSVYAEDGCRVLRLGHWAAEARSMRVMPLLGGELEIALLDAAVPNIEEDAEILRLEALETALATFVRSVGAEGVVIGLSGGIDSALSSAIAVKALGADRVTGLMLASRYTSEESRALVRALTLGLGLPYVERSIECVHAAMTSSMWEDFGGIKPGEIPDQNLQARIRGTWLMGVSNATNRIALCNANKAECAMGYGTLYGDIAGGYAPLADLWKREVRMLANAVNRRAGKEVIPEGIINREPTAELRPGQRDRDSLPPYDRIEEVIMTKAMRWPSEASEDLDERRILRLFGAMRFKRDQAPAFPRMSLMPLTKIDACWPSGVLYPAS